MKMLASGTSVEVDGKLVGEVGVYDVKKGIVYIVVGRGEDKAYPISAIKVYRRKGCQI